MTQDLMKRYMIALGIKMMMMTGWILSQMWNGLGKTCLTEVTF